MDLEKFDLHYPGHWIAGTDRDWAFETAHLLSLLESEFIGAVAAYSRFEPLTVENYEQRISRQRSKYDDSANIIYAKAFVCSLDMITKILNVLKNPPETVRELISQYNVKFGDLKHIRDSLAHIEDRGRGLDKDKKEISATILALGVFAGRRYEVTASNGVRYRVEISESTLFSAHEVLQAIINAYEWE
jgi:hypothetical protein